MRPMPIAITIALTLSIRSIITPNKKAQNMLIRFVATITGTTLPIDSEGERPIAYPLVMAHCDIKRPLMDTSARARNVAPYAKAIFRIYYGLKTHRN